MSDFFTCFNSICIFFFQVILRDPQVNNKSYLIKAHKNKDTWHFYFFFTIPLLNTGCQVFQNSARVKEFDATQVQEYAEVVQEQAEVVQEHAEGVQENDAQSIHLVVFLHHLCVFLHRLCVFLHRRCVFLHHLSIFLHLDGVQSLHLGALFQNT